MPSGNFTDYLGLATDLFKTGYNLFTNKRDFDYQKAMQQQIFEREDTAVQRRKADLLAAGFNPSLAEGSGAGAGQVVARSNTNDLGSTLDTLQAVNSIKAQRQQVKNLQTEGEILRTKKIVDQFNQTLNEMMVLKALGYNVQPNTYKGFGYTYEGDYLTEKPSDYGDNYLFKELVYANQNLKNNAEMLEKQNNWFTANQVINALTSTAGAITGGINSGANMKRANAPWKRYR